jgi:hypothetical protein
VVVWEPPVPVPVVWVWVPPTPPVPAGGPPHAVILETANHASAFSANANTFIMVECLIDFSSRFRRDLPGPAPHGLAEEPARCLGPRLAEPLDDLRGTTVWG